MIVGETRYVELVEKATMPYAFSSAPTVSVVTPAGDTLSPAPTVNVSPAYATSAISHTLTANVPFTEGGPYEVTWTLPESPQTIKRRQTYFAFYTDVPTKVRNLLRKSATQLTEQQLGDEAAAIYRRLLERWSCIGDYTDLTGASRVNVDDALVYIMAARMLYIAQTGGAYGTVKAWRVGDVQINYEKGGHKVEEYMRMAARPLSYVPCIQEALTALRSGYALHALGGPSRANAERGIMPSIMTTLASLLDADSYYQSGTV